MDIKEILEQLDFSKKDIKTLTDEDAKTEDFQEIFKDKFIAREMASRDEDIQKSVLGRRMTDIEKEMKKTFSLSTDDVEGKHIEDVLKLVGENHEKVLGEKDKAIEELKDTTPQDEKLEKLQGQFNQVTEAKTKLETDLQESNKKNEDLLTDHEKELSKIETTTLFNNIKGEIKFADSVSSLEKDGFFSMINNKFEFKLEDGKLTPLDKKGEKIPNEKGTEFLDTQQVLMKEAGENKLLKVNDADVKPHVPNKPDAPVDPNQKVRTLHPDSQGYDETIKDTPSIMERI